MKIIRTMMTTGAKAYHAALVHSIRYCLKIHLYCNSEIDRVQIQERVSDDSLTVNNEGHRIIYQQNQKGEKYSRLLARKDAQLYCDSGTI